MEFPPSTQSFAMSLAAQKKHEADMRIQGTAQNIVQMTMLEMFEAGYRRALKDHQIPASEEQIETVMENPT